MIRIILSSFFLILIFSISKFIFDPAYLYYELPWLDIPMHIIGGIAVAFFILSIFSYLKIRISYVQLVLGYVFIACSWEIYEHILNYIYVGTWYGNRLPLKDGIDTMKDIVNGFIGMSVLYLFMKKK